MLETNDNSFVNFKKISGTEGQCDGHTASQNEPTLNALRTTFRHFSNAVLKNNK